MGMQIRAPRPKKTGAVRVAKGPRIKKGGFSMAKLKGRPM